jgi:DNA-binding IclR family transcriptional regulator
MPRPRTSVTPETPKVLEKALRVLEAFNAQSPEWAEVDLRRALGIPSTTLNRILRHYERSGYLLRTEAGRYRLGVAAIRLGNRASASLNLPAVLDSQLHAVARDTGELVIVAVPEFSTGHARYIANAESSHRLRVTAEVGATVPMTAGATAKTLLAFQPQPQIEAVLARPLERLAGGTVMDTPAIRADLETIRARGWGFSWEETYDGAWAVAAPLIDGEEQALAAIGIAAPTTRHNDELEKRLRDAVIGAAEQAAATLRLRGGESSRLVG